MHMGHSDNKHFLRLDLSLLPNFANTPFSLCHFWFGYCRLSSVCVCVSVSAYARVRAFVYVCMCHGSNMRPQRGRSVRLTRVTCCYRVEDRQRVSEGSNNTFLKEWYNPRTKKGLLSSLCVWWCDNIHPGVIYLLQARSKKFSECDHCRGCPVFLSLVLCTVWGVWSLSLGPCDFICSWPCVCLQDSRKVTLWLVGHERRNQKCNSHELLYSGTFLQFSILQLSIAVCILLQIQRQIKHS